MNDKDDNPNGSGADTRNKIIHRFEKTVLLSQHRFELNCN